MEVDYALLADAAQISEGKLYILGGGFDQLWAPQFPVVHPTMSLAVKLKLHPTECNRQHNLEIQLWDADGKNMGGMNGGFSAPFPQDPGKSVYVQLVFEIHGQQFPQPGGYDFHIVVNGQHMKTLTLYVEQAIAPSSPGGQERPGV